MDSGPEAVSLGKRNEGTLVHLIHPEKLKSISQRYPDTGTHACTTNALKCRQRRVALERLGKGARTLGTNAVATDAVCVRVREDRKKKERRN